MKNLKEMFYKHKEGILYLVFGFVTTIVNWGSYSILTKYLLLNYNISNIIAWVLAVGVSFVTTKLWVFESETHNFGELFKEIISFVSSRVLTGFFEIVALPFAVGLGLDQSIFGVENFLAKIIISVIGVILNYFLSKFVVFKHK